MKHTLGLFGFMALALSAQGALVSYWTFDDPANTHADSVGGATLTDPGAAGEVATWGVSTGFNGSGGFSFDGNDRLIAPVDVNTSVMPQMTWGAWVRTDSLAAGLRKVMGHDNGAWDRTIGLDTRDASFRYTSFTGFQRPIEGSPGPLNTTDWTFLAATYDQGAQAVTIYVDLDATSTADALVSVTEVGNFNAGWPTFAIGGIRPDIASEGWVGAIDQAFVFNELLTPAQLTQIRDHGFVVPEPSIAAYTLLVAGALFPRRRRRA